MNNKEKLLKLAEMYKDAAENKKGFLKYDKGWDGWITTTSSPNIKSNLLEWKVAPKSKIVNLSWAIKSQVDMNLGSNDIHYAPINAIRLHESSPYKSVFNKWYKQCTYRTNNWILHEGEHTVPPEGVIIKVKCRDGVTIINSTAAAWGWAISKLSNDVIAYQITGLEEGWKYPWEDK